MPSMLNSHVFAPPKMVVGNFEFRQDNALVLGIDGELREEVLLILVDAAEPIVVCYRDNTWDAQDFVSVVERQRLNDRRAIDDDEPVGTSDVGAAAERALDDREKRKQEERDGEGSDSQDQANLFAEEIREDESSK